MKGMGKGGEKTTKVGGIKTPFTKRIVKSIGGKR